MSLSYGWYWYIYIYIFDIWYIKYYSIKTISSFHFYVSLRIYLLLLLSSPFSSHFLPLSLLTLLLSLSGRLIGSRPLRFTLICCSDWVYRSYRGSVFIQGGKLSPTKLHSPNWPCFAVNFHKKSKGSVTSMRAGRRGWSRSRTPQPAINQGSTHLPASQGSEVKEEGQTSTSAPAQRTYKGA